MLQNSLPNRRAVFQEMVHNLLFVKYSSNGFDNCNKFIKLEIPMYKILIALMFLGCAAEVTEDIETETNTETDYKYSYLPTIGGTSFNSGCDYYKSNSLVIDPDFSEIEIENIRKGIQLWEDALGIELGDKISEENCSRTNVVKNCIVKIDDERIDYEQIKPQIFLFMKALENHNFDERHLVDVTAHELGHYIGLGHIETGMMDGKRGLILNPVITDADLRYYAETCFGLKEDQKTSVH